MLNATLDAVAEIIDWLSGDPLSVVDWLEQFGTVTRDYGPNALLVPHNSLFSRANVVRRIDPDSHRPTDTPAYITLRPAEPLPLATLAETFGQYKLVPAEEGIPLQAVFYLEMPDRPYTVALIAEVEDERAILISLRRDPSISS